MYIQLEDILKHNPCEEGKELAIKLFAGRQRMKLTSELLNMPEVGKYFGWLLGEGIINLSHAKVVITSGNAEYNYLFARYVEGADIEAHAQVVIASGNAEYNYSFARCVKGADIEAHAKAVIASGNVKYNYLLGWARGILGVHINN